MLDFLFENGCVLYYRQYNNSRISYFHAKSACLSYCSFSYLVFYTAEHIDAACMRTKYFSLLVKRQNLYTGSCL